MKTIVLIGKPDERTQSIHSFLHSYFRVQLCTENPQSALGMIRVVTPDLAVINLSGFTAAEEILFAGIRREFPNLPVITAGTEGEQLPFAAYYSGEQFRHLRFPAASIEDIFSAVCLRLGLSEREVKREAEALNDNRKKVLVVDDNASTLRSIKGMLDARYNVTLANSGMKALTSIGKSRPDVILLDYEMPVCDGKQTLEMIRADEDMSSIPVIFLTSVNDKEHIQAVIKLLPAGYMLKPAVPNKLIAAIEKALGNET